jgi:hypothetical protein
MNATAPIPCVGAATNISAPDNRKRKHAASGKDTHLLNNLNS